MPRHDEPECGLAAGSFSPLVLWRL